MAESELISFEWTRQQAEKATDQSSVKKLAAIGPPPYTGSNWRSKYVTESGAFGVVLRNLVFSREYTMLDRIYFFRGVFQSVDALYPELSRIDLLLCVGQRNVLVRNAWHR